MLQRIEWTFADLGDLCNRLRRTELFDDDARFAFYDRRLPDGIVSGRHFDRWWKNARRDRPDLLTFSAAELAEEGVAYDPADYPDTWRQHDVELPVTYLYDPGNDLDGVTVHVPMALLNRVDGSADPDQVAESIRSLVSTLSLEEG